MAATTDHLGRPIVVVTGMGMVTPLGIGREENWNALVSGKSGVTAITRFPIEHLNTQIAGTVDFLESSGKGITELTSELAIRATTEALEQAGLNDGAFGGPLFVASPPIELDWDKRFELADRGDRELPPVMRLLQACRISDATAYFRNGQFSSVAEQLSAKYGTVGIPITLSTACASGTTAIQLAVEAIRRGECDRALSVGADGSASAEALIRFSLLSALSTQNALPQKASKPFSRDRDGFVLAEGSAALVLESLESAMARGAGILGVVSGCGEKADNFHRTRSSPDGAPAIAAVRAALDDAAVATSDIAYINAHGTSTPENDKMEYLSLSTVFGEEIRSIPVSSNKSMIGHTLSASGAIEAVVSVMTMQNGIIPPTINYDNPDPAIELDVVPNEARAADVATILSNSFGFGGQNACLVLRREPV